jgi:site-specific DNA-methyltransferase (adenine-specific)
MSTPTEKICRSTDYFTPPRILDPVREYFGGRIDLDPATTWENPTGARRIHTPANSGLDAQWIPYRVFVNPPYGRVLRRWVGKIYEESRKGCEIVALLPGQRFEQKYWQVEVFNPTLIGFCMVRKRVSFLRPDGTVAKGNPYGSFVYLYNGDFTRFEKAFSEVGLCIRIDYDDEI